jgi:hypothetical protein
LREWISRRCQPPYRRGTDVYQSIDAPAAGDRSTGLRVLRSHAGADGLDLLVEGLAGATCRLHVITPRRLLRIAAPDLTDVRIESGTSAEPPTLLITFPGKAGEYVRKKVHLALSQGEIRNAR